MELRLPAKEPTEIRWPAATAATTAGATAPGPHRPVDETPDEPPGMASAADSDFSVGAPASLRPADPLVGSTVNTMLAIYRAKYRLDVGTIVFEAHKAKAAEVRAWCNAMAPGECRLLLAGSSRGFHTFVLAVGRSRDGTPRCLMVDSAGPCMGGIKLALQREFGRQVYVTPIIQGTQELGCMVFAMRFLLMSRCADLGARVLETMEAYEARNGLADEGQLQVGDMAPLAGWLAGTRHRRAVALTEPLPSLPLDNGGRHANWTLGEFFERRPATLVPELRQIYSQVDAMAQEPQDRRLLDQHRAYLHHRFVRHLPR